MGVCLLAPIPAIFMESALRTCEAQGCVAFGTNAFEVFAKLDEEYGEGVPVLIYPTGHHGNPHGICDPGYANFRAVYRKAQPAWRGRHPTPALRPAATVEGDQADSAWAMFWEVSDLVQLSKADRVPITGLTAEGKTKALSTGFVPHGPLLVTALIL